MRDNFYHWIAVALLFAILFGAEVARADAGKADWFLIISYGALGILATVGAIDHYKQAKAGGDA